jgi:RimJ/RimL family protein N-acetyltransferase
VTGLSIRPFVAADIACLHQIRSDAFVHVFQSFRDILGPEIAAVAMRGAEDEQAALLDGFANNDDGKELLVACVEDQVIGFAALSYDAAQAVGEIVITAIDTKWAGNGYGTALNLAACDRMKGRGMLVATVGTGGDPSHAAARRAYENSCFTSVIPNLVYYRSLVD